MAGLLVMSERGLQLLARAFGHTLSPCVQGEPESNGPNATRIDVCMRLLSATAGASRRVAGFQIQLSSLHKYTGGGGWEGLRKASVCTVA